MRLLNYGGTGFSFSAGSAPSFGWVKISVRKTKPRDRMAPGWFALIDDATIRFLSRRQGRELLDFRGVGVALYHSHFGFRENYSNRRTLPTNAFGEIILDRAEKPTNMAHGRALADTFPLPVSYPGTRWREMCSERAELPTRTL